MSVLIFRSSNYLTASWSVQRCVGCVEGTHKKIMKDSRKQHRNVVQRTEGRKNSLGNDNWGGHFLIKCKISNVCICGILVWEKGISLVKSIIQSHWTIWLDGCLINIRIILVLHFDDEIKRQKEKQQKVLCSVCVFFMWIYFYFPFTCFTNINRKKKTKIVIQNIFYKL